MSRKRLLIALAYLCALPALLGAGLMVTNHNTRTVSVPAYAADDQVGGLQSLNAITDMDDNTAVLQSVAVLDQGKQSAALTIFFFQDRPSVASVDNGPLQLTDSEMQKCIGTVQVAAADYQTVTGSSIATVRNIGLHLLTSEIVSSSNMRSYKLYALVKTTGTPTYVSTTDLVFKYSFEQ